MDSMDLMDFDKNMINHIFLVPVTIATGRRCQFFDMN